MKKYFKPKIVLQILEDVDILTTSIDSTFREDFDNGGDDIIFD